MSKNFIELNKSYFIVSMIASIFIVGSIIYNTLDSKFEREVKLDNYKKRILLDLTKKFYTYGRIGFHDRIFEIFADSIEYYSYPKKDKKKLNFKKGNKFQKAEFDFLVIDDSFTLTSDGLSSNYDLVKTLDGGAVKIVHSESMNYIESEEDFLISKIQIVRTDTTIRKNTYGVPNRSIIQLRKSPSLDAEYVLDSKKDRIKIDKNNFVRIENTIVSKKMNEAFIKATGSGVKVLENKNKKYLVENIYNNEKILVNKEEVNVISGWYYIRDLNDSNIRGYVCKDFIIKYAAN
ncbi:hypothetical protein [Kordia jejudonensis]|uniref:hypothetical protein n=1 Tax=Kordia jejudonensis TaxID=1348245 RepID=UPI0006299274|nr:hypothetical protein [Kordia jejudonensis]